MSFTLPSISPDLARIAPGFRALSINVIAAPVRDVQVGETALKEACQAVLNGQPAWGQAHIDAWNAVFKAFGAKPGVRHAPQKHYESVSYGMEQWRRWIRWLISITP